LIVTEGIGYYQEKGKPIQVIKEGDVVKIPVSAEHWHGGSHSSLMVHTAIVPTVENGTIWLQPVTDAEYNTVQTINSSQSSKVNLSDAAVRNHEQLWPGYQSKAKATDPELIEVFDNFAFDELIRHDTMDVRTRVTMIMASTIGSQALTEYKMFVNAALNVGVTPIEIKEVLYQAVPYVGVAKVIDFIYACNEIFTERDISLPLESQSTTTSETRHEKGLIEVSCRQTLCLTCLPRRHDLPSQGSLPNLLPHYLNTRIPGRVFAALDQFSASEPIPTTLVVAKHVVRRLTKQYGSGLFVCEPEKVVLRKQLLLQTLW